MEYITFTTSLPGLTVKGTNLPVVAGLEARVDALDAERLVKAGLARRGLHADDYC